MQTRMLSFVRSSRASCVSPLCTRLFRPSVRLVCVCVCVLLSEGVTPMTSPGGAAVVSTPAGRSARVSRVSDAALGTVEESADEGEEEGPHAGRGRGRGRAAKARGKQTKRTRAAHEEEEEEEEEGEEEGAAMAAASEAEEEEESPAKAAPGRRGRKRGAQ